MVIVLLLVSVRNLCIWYVKFLVISFGLGRIEGLDMMVILI